MEFVVGQSRVESYEFPWYYRRSREQVTAHSLEIERAAEHQDLDAELVRAVVWIETTHGWYDLYTGLLKKPKTLLPMNVFVDYWAALGISRDELTKPRINIEVGTYILAEIKRRLRNANVSTIATLYNNLGAVMVSGYGKTVAQYYRLRPWTEATPKKGRG